ncbi:phosphatase PAP2 family protein [Winogradskyella psychrotolerans]|uniref:phosphatase PAP2 family protein n=1 Tax=Winogradskyella psychrotolerans TaxID=1344585 RepID=UPI001C0752B4|nr:phosphatase PAP2 family protein [Winogradskyella psychrotolerans]MBU2928820.1 phosphatase PAP2 family protein [Winogradskyella psychrotolerans]
MQNVIKLIIHKFKQLVFKLFKKPNDQLPYILISVLAILIVIASTYVFIELTRNLKTTTLAQFDTTITDYILTQRNPPLTKYFIVITDIGDVYGYLFVFTLCSLAFILILKKWTYAVQLIVVICLALSSNSILKKLINRSRPELEHLVTIETLSYPSGHAMTAMAFYGFLIYLFYQFKINLIVKLLLILLFSFLIVSIGISRIYLGVHFPSDIVGGYIAGFIWVILCALIFNIIKMYRKEINA